MVIIRFAWLIAILLVCVQGAESQSAPDNHSSKSVGTEYAKEEVIAALTESLTSIDSLFAEYKKTITEEGRRSVIRCQYARDGHKWHITEFSEGADFVRSQGKTISFDGERCYSYYSKTDGGLGSVQIRDSHQPPTISPECLLGMKLSTLDDPLSALLQSQDNLVTLLEGGGAEVVRLHLGLVHSGVIVKGTQVTYDVTASIDTGHGMLPSEIRVEPSDEYKKVTETHRDWFQRWQITKFASVLDESANTHRWFPTEGHLEQGGVPLPSDRGPQYELSISNVRLNAKLKPTLFKPDIPSGTTIIDLTVGGGGGISISGGPEVVAKRFDDLANAARDVSNEPSIFMRWLVVGNVGLLLLGAAMVIRRRRRQL